MTDVKQAPKVGEVVPQPGRDAEGKWLPGRSPNPKGRPKGSRNRITVLKAMAEEAVRENHTGQMLRVVHQIIQQAEEGDREAQKLVWNAIMSKGLSDSDGKGKEKVEIKIGRMPDSADAVTITGTTTDEEENDDES